LQRSRRDEVPWGNVVDRRPRETAKARQHRLDVEDVVYHRNGAEDRAEVARLCDDFGAPELADAVYAEVRRKRELYRRRRRADRRSP
jgi:hypothetical protein